MTNSEVFIVEGHKRTSTQSVTSEVIADYLEQVANEDADSYYVTPPGPLKKINTKAVSPLNDLEQRSAVKASMTNSGMKNSYGRFPSHSFQARLPGYAARPRTVAPSQSAPDWNVDADELATAEVMAVQRNFQKGNLDFKFL